MARTKTHLVRIGNSRGVRLPKVLIEQAGLEDEVELEVRGSTIVIGARSGVRRGWADAARRLHEDGLDDLVGPSTATSFDDEEWKW